MFQRRSRPDRAEAEQISNLMTRHVERRATSVGSSGSCFIRASVDCNRRATQLAFLA